VVTYGSALWCKWASTPAVHRHRGRAWPTSPSPEPCTRISLHLRRWWWAAWPPWLLHSQSPVHCSTLLVGLDPVTGSTKRLPVLPIPEQGVCWSLHGGDVIHQLRGILALLADGVLLSVGSAVSLPPWAIATLGGGATSQHVLLLMLRVQAGRGAALGAQPAAFISACRTENTSTGLQQLPQVSLLCSAFGIGGESSTHLTTASRHQCGARPR
jgi:hypothetical protein